MPNPESTPKQGSIVRITRGPELMITILKSEREPQPGPQRQYSDISEVIVELVGAVKELPEAVVGVDLEGWIATLMVSPWASSSEIGVGAIAEFEARLGVHVEFAEADKPSTSDDQKAPGWSESPLGIS